MLLGLILHSKWSFWHTELRDECRPVVGCLTPLLDYQLIVTPTSGFMATCNDGFGYLQRMLRKISVFSTVLTGLPLCRKGQSPLESARAGITIPHRVVIQNKCTSSERVRSRLLILRNQFAITYVDGSELTVFTASA